MKKIGLFVFFIAFLSCKNDRRKAVLGASDFQIEMNTKFKDASKSPLTKKGLKEFNGLDFFTINNTFKVQATLNKIIDGPIVEFPTTTERVALYTKYGVLSFSIAGKEFELVVYKDVKPKPEYADYLFLPFLDTTNGKTSYKGGRFVDLYITDISKDNTIVIDFNKAYNPYCAYSDRYSCPITPRDNFLDIDINAGVKAYKKTE